MFFLGGRLRQVLLYRSTFLALVAIFSAELNCLYKLIIVHLTLLDILYTNLEMSSTMKFFFVSLHFRDVLKLI